MSPNLEALNYHSQDCPKPLDPKPDRTRDNGEAQKSLKTSSMVSLLAYFFKIHRRKCLPGGPPLVVEGVSTRRPTNLGDTVLER